MGKKGEVWEPSIVRRLSLAPSYSSSSSQSIQICLSSWFEMIAEFNRLSHN